MNGKQYNAHYESNVYDIIYSFHPNHITDSNLRYQIVQRVKCYTTADSSASAFHTLQKDIESIALSNTYGLVERSLKSRKSIYKYYSNDTLYNINTIIKLNTNTTYSLTYDVRNKESFEKYKYTNIKSLDSLTIYKDKSGTNTIRHTYPDKSEYDSIVYATTPDNNIDTYYITNVYKGSIDDTLNISKPLIIDNIDKYIIANASKLTTLFVQRNQPMQKVKSIRLQYSNNCSITISYNLKYQGGHTRFLNMHIELHSTYTD